jgi:hypothetical protein
MLSPPNTAANLRGITPRPELTTRDADNGPEKAPGGQEQGPADSMIAALPQRQFRHFRDRPAD